MGMWHILSGCRAIRQRKRDAVARHDATLEHGGHTLTAECYFRNLHRREFRERLRVTARDNECVAGIDRTDIEKCDDQSGLKHHAHWCFIRENLAEDATHVRLTPQLGRRVTKCPAPDPRQRVPNGVWRGRSLALYDARTGAAANRDFVKGGED